MLREGQGDLLANTIRATYVVVSYLAPTTHVWGGVRVDHVPVRTTTLPLARSAYINNSSSEMTVVMARV
jgi:hypothetical protein